VISQKPTALPHALVIGLDSMTGLQTARLLARRGVPVIGLARDLEHFCCRTRVCQRIIETDIKGEELIQTLEALGLQFGSKAVLVPCTDMSVLLISRNRARLEPWYRFALPAEETVELLIDKQAFYEYARQAGLAAPATYFLRSRAEAEQAAQTLVFPCILKPPVKTPTWENHNKSKVYKVDSPQELLEVYDRTSGWADLLMAQEWIPGPDSELYSCNCYYNAAGQPLVTFIARKIRQWPPEAGTSCLGEEVRNDVVLQESLRLFGEAGYHGLGYVEMKRDARTGKHYIIEPNIGRPTGRSAISEAGGVELVYTQYCDLAGLPLPANREQKYTGVKWIYLRRDIQSALYYWRRGELTLRGWWESWKGRKTDAIFSLTDPAPFFADLFRAAGLAFGSPRKRAFEGGPQGKAGLAPGESPAEASSPAP
jgi:predicted ATP-grasp superfamily ATP-dependent carboligase